MKGHYKLILLIAISLASCSPKLKDEYNGQIILDICDLPNHINETVILKATYSGMEEYWSLNSVKSKKCSAELLVNLDFEENYKIPHNFEKMLTKIHNSYWNSYLTILAKGKYENSNPNGYGHLGTKKSRFLISEIINIELIKREK
ncbi:MAG: hypothetical protein WC622_12760 [Pedobacter sp.]|jgi:hypothetical protein|uniref:hypothetical protein n=1 Tax=Pedobacter sp. TaxID=1411316 RepID=UPI0035621955